MVSNGNYTLRLEFSFEAAHFLPLHEGKCKNIHGHTYKVWIYCTTPTNIDNDKSWVIDFGIIKSLAKQVIDDFDHSLITGTHKMYDSVTKAIRSIIPYQRIIKLSSKQATVEAICEELYRRISAALLPYNVNIVYIEVAETSSNIVCFEPNRTEYILK